MGLPGLGREWHWLAVRGRRGADVQLHPAVVRAATGLAGAAKGLTAAAAAPRLKGAREVYGVEIDYIGVWNERSSDATYVQTLKKTLADAGYPKVKIVAKDGGADICDDMAKDPAYKEAVDIIGLHCEHSNGLSPHAAV